MTVLSIPPYPQPILRKPTEVVQSVTPEIRQLATNMIQTMYAANGVGLAANQVGQSLRLFVAQQEQGEGKELVLINPVIVKKSGRLREEEGCLSLPGMSALVNRYSHVTLRGQTLDGQEQVIEADGLLARILQHETDHLNGLLYVHRIWPWARWSLLRHYRTEQQQLQKIQIKQ